MIYLGFSPAYGCQTLIEIDKRVVTHSLDVVFKMCIYAIWPHLGLKHATVPFLQWFKTFS